MLLTWSQPEIRFFQGSDILFQLMSSMSWPSDALNSHRKCQPSTFWILLCWKRIHMPQLTYTRQLTYTPQLAYTPQFTYTRQLIYTPQLKYMAQVTYTCQLTYTRQLTQSTNVHLNLQIVCHHSANINQLWQSCRPFRFKVSKRQGLVQLKNNNSTKLS